MKIVTITQILELLSKSTTEVYVANKDIKYVDAQKLIDNICVMFKVNADGTTNKEMIEEQLLTDFFSAAAVMGIVTRDTTIEEYVKMEHEEDDIDEEDFIETSEMLCDMFGISDAHNYFDKELTIAQVAEKIATILDREEREDEETAEDDDGDDEDE